MRYNFSHFELGTKHILEFYVILSSGQQIRYNLCHATRLEFTKPVTGTAQDNTLIQFVSFRSQDNMLYNLYHFEFRIYYRTVQFV